MTNCSDNSMKKERAARLGAIADKLKRVQHKVLVLSGKGGVGKSTVAVNLAVELSRRGHQVGLLDIDVHGPSVPGMLGLDSQRPGYSEAGIAPVIHGKLKVMSLGFLTGASDSAVIWRGPMKIGAIEQLLGETNWGDLDFLVIDCPPGTGDEPLSIAQLVPEAHALIVTTPQRIAALDVRKSISFARRMELEIIGVVKNMSGMTCPTCGDTVHPFPQGPADLMCTELNVPLVASLPLDPATASQADNGVVAQVGGDSLMGAAIRGLTTAVFVNFKQPKLAAVPAQSSAEDGRRYSLKEECMRLAIPIEGNRLCSHFGHCSTFAFVDVNQETKSVVARQDLAPPPHEPGVIPKWVAEQGADLVLAGGMGARAVSLFESGGVKVFTGCPAQTPEELAQGFLDGTLQRGSNECGHGSSPCGG